MACKYHYKDKTFNSEEEFKDYIHNNFEIVKSDFLKTQTLNPEQDALRQQLSEKEVPYTGTAGKNISESGEGIRPSEQGEETTGTRTEEQPQLNERSTEEEIGEPSEVPVTENGTQPIFFYGTLTNQDTLDKALGIKVPVQNSSAFGKKTNDNGNPVFIPGGNKEVKGVLANLTPEQINTKLKDEWGEGKNYDLKSITLSDGTKALAFIYKKPITDENQEVSTKGSEVPNTQSQEEGKNKALLNRAFEGATDEEVKKSIETHGLTYTPESHEEARSKADKFINDVGLDKALESAKKNEIDDGAAAFVWAKAIDQAENNPELQAELLNEFDKRARSSGRFISALQDVYLNSDFNYSLERQLKQYAEAGGKISQELQSKFDTLSKELQSANARIKELESQKTGLDKIRQEAQRQRAKLISEDRRKQISSMFDSLKGDVPKGLMMSSPAPLAIAVWNGSIEVVKKAVLAGIDVANAIQAGLDYIKEHSNQPINEDKYKEVVTPIVQNSVPKEQIVAPTVHDGKIKIPESLLRELVANGATTIEELTDQVHSLVKETNPEITNREVRDAITKYGKTASMNQDELSTEIRKMKRIGRMLSALEDVRKKIRPLRSGLQRDKLTDQERRMQREIKNEMKDLPVDQEEEARTWKTALDAVKSRLTNQIADLETQIETGEKTPKKKGIEYDVEATRLKERRDELKKILEDMEGKPEMSPEQRTKMAVKAAEKSAEEYERRIKDKDFSKRKLNPATETEELIEARKRRDEAKKLYTDLKEKEGVAEKESIERSKKIVTKQIQDYEKRIKDKDFTKKEPKKIQQDEELKKLKIKKNQIKEEFDIEQEKNRLANRSKAEKAYDAVVDVLNLPKSLLASIDMSAPFRQGLVLMATNPKASARAFKEMFAQAFSGKKASEWLHALRLTDEYQEMKQSGLYIAEPNVKLTAKEEQFLSNFAERIPLLGKLVAGSSRAYTGYLNKLRTDVFTWGANNLKDQGITMENNPDAYKAWASFVNNATGRGNLGALENSAPILNAAFFSPRFVASRFNLLNPVTYAKMPQPVRVMAMKNMLGYIAFISVMLALGGAAGAEVEKDPRSTDFMKLKFGNTRYDLSGGFQSLIRFFSQLATGQVKRSGKILELSGDKYPNETRADLIARFARSKFAPTMGIAADLLTGKDFVGQPVTWDQELLKATIPLYLQDMNTVIKQEGISGVAASAIPAFFGVGVQTYEQKPEKKKREKTLKEELNEITRPLRHEIDSIKRSMKPKI